MTAGYSKRGLADKLGIKPGTRIVAVHAPTEYPSLLGTLPDRATLQSRLSSGAGFIHWFVRQQNELSPGFPRMARSLADDGALWVSWPKQRPGARTDLTENVIREFGLKEGLVDVKVIAVDEIWSGLKFVRRLVNRSPKGK